MTVRLVSITPNAEQLIVRCARVSSANPDNPEYEGLLRYLVAHSHWSPLEMAHAVLEIKTSRAIAAQILRHRSFAFQEFSQRYSSDIGQPVPVLGRKQAVKNRQSSTDGLADDAQVRWQLLQKEVYGNAYDAYDYAINTINVSREQARMLLPLAAPTTVLMAGSLRSYVHYVSLRCQEDTQQEHREIAEACRDILAKELPVLAKALNWVE